MTEIKRNIVVIEVIKRKVNTVLVSFGISIIDFFSIIFGVKYKEEEITFVIIPIKARMIKARSLILFYVQCSHEFSFLCYQ